SRKRPAPWIVARLFQQPPVEKFTNHLATALMIPYAGEMKTPTIPDALLAEASEAVIKALQRAFDEGYERGRLDAVNRVMAAAQGIATGPIEAMARGYDVPKSLIGGAGGGGEKVHPNAAEKRRFP